MLPRPLIDQFAAHVFQHLEIDQGDLRPLLNYAVADSKEKSA